MGWGSATAGRVQCCLTVSSHCHENVFLPFLPPYTCAATLSRRCRPALLKKTKPMRLGPTASVRAVAPCWRVPAQRIRVRLLDSISPTASQPCLWMPLLASLAVCDHPHHAQVMHGHQLPATSAPPPPYRRRPTHHGGARRQRHCGGRLCCWSEERAHVRPSQCHLGILHRPQQQGMAS